MSDLASYFAARFRQARDLAANPQLDSSPPTPVRADVVHHLAVWSAPTTGILPGHNTGDPEVVGVSAEDQADYARRSNPPVVRGARWH